MGAEGLAAPSRTHPHPWALGVNREAAEQPHTIFPNTEALQLWPRSRLQPALPRSDMAGSSTCPWGWVWSDTLWGLRSPPSQQRALDWQAAQTWPTWVTFTVQACSSPPALPAFTSGVVT